MKAIYKFPLIVQSSQYISTPIDFKPLSVQVQKNTIYLWALCGSVTKNVSRCIRIYGTGHGSVIGDKDCYLGTVQHNGYVWHLFLEHMP